MLHDDDDDDDDDYDDDDDDYDNDDDQTIAFIKVPAEDAGYGALDQATVEVKIMLSKTMIRIMKKYGKKCNQQYCKKYGQKYYKKYGKKYDHNSEKSKV